MTDTTIQEKENSEEFARLRALMNSSSSMSHFISSVNRGIMKRSNGQSELTSAGIRSLEAWYDYKHPSHHYKTERAQRRFEFEDELQQLRARYLSFHPRNRVQTVKVGTARRIMIFNSHGRLIKQPRYIKALSRKYRSKSKK